MLLEEMRNQSNFSSRVRQIFALTFDSQNKLATEQNIISIPLAPNLPPSVIVFLAKSILYQAKLLKSNTIQKRNIKVIKEKSWNQSNIRVIVYRLLQDTQHP